MPEFGIDGDVLDVPRNISLIDTNVLVSMFSPTDSLHSHTTAYFEVYDDHKIAITPPVVVESCGLLAARRDVDKIQRLLDWVITPGNAYVFPTHFRPTLVAGALSETTSWMRQRDLDYVDAYLLHAAHAITSACGISPSVPILTYDTGDFFKCAKQTYKFSLIDPRQPEDFIDFGF